MGNLGKCPSAAYTIQKSRLEQITISLTSSITFSQFFVSSAQVIKVYNLVPLNSFLNISMKNCKPISYSDSFPENFLAKKIS